MDIDTLSNEWVLAQTNKKVDDEFNHWSIDYVIDLYFGNEFEELWDFIKATYVKNLPSDVFNTLSAGAMEDFICGAGEEYFEKIEYLAGEDEKFKKLLSGVWKGDMSDELWGKVCSLIKKRN